MFISTAFLDFKTELSIATPCSVKAKGGLGLNLMFSGRLSQIVITSTHSFLLNSNIKSTGKR